MTTGNLIDGTELHDVAAAHGIKPRTLTKWRAQGLLPRHVEQIGHRQAGKTYLYPPESKRQLERVIYWKSALGKQPKPQKVGWALWCDGFDIDPELVGAIAEDGETSSVAHRDCKPGVREGLPPVRVVDHVADGSLAVDRGDSPVEPDAIAWPAFVFAERIG